MKFSSLFMISILFTIHLFAQNEDLPVFSTNKGAIDGFDPVAYFVDKAPQKGASNITSDYKGAKWHFATVKNKELFDKDPDKYAPEYGGWCAYGWAQGYPAKIDPKAWSIVDGKLYLNYNKSIRKKWDKEQEEFINQADINYKKAHHEI